MTIKLKDKKVNVPLFEIISFLVLFTYALSLIMPLIWSFLTSFKGRIEYRLNPVGWPNSWEFLYDDVLAQFRAPITKNNITTEDGGTLAIMLINSLWYSLGTSFVSTTVSFLVGYIVARFRFKFCEAIYTVVILQMIIPTVGTLPSEIALAQAIGVYNTIHGMLFMKSYVTGLYFLSFYAALRVIPKDYEEAAYLDGAGNFEVMLNIMLPMAAGVFGTILLLNFINFWNDYQTPMIYMPGYPTLAYGLYYLCNVPRNGVDSSVPSQMAGCMVMAIPLLVLFLICQDKLLNNVSLGGLK